MKRSLFVDHSERWLSWSFNAMFLFAEGRLKLMKGEKYYRELYCFMMSYLLFIEISLFISIINHVCMILLADYWVSCWLPT